MYLVSHPRSAATKMANSGCTSEALKHKFSWRSEKMTTEYVSGSHAALVANARALTSGVGGGEPRGRQLARVAQPGAGQPSHQQPTVSINHLLS